MRWSLPILLACTSTSSVEPEPLLDWSWRSADLHVHSSLGSNDTDGFGTPEALGGAMQAAGLDLVWLTDHSNSQGSMDCPEVEDCPNQGPEITEGDWPEGVWPGSEISPYAGEEHSDVPTGHVGCLPLNGESFSSDAFVDRPTGEVSGGEAVQQCLDSEGYAVLNHPFGPTTWVAYDWTSMDFNAVEIFNGGAGFDHTDEAALDYWMEGLAEGYRWVPVGASDSHNWSTEPPGGILQSALGWPRTELGFVGEELPIDALRAGRTILSDPSSQLRMHASADGQVVGPGGSIAGPMTLHIEASTEEEDMRLQLLRLPDQLLLDQHLDSQSVHHCIELEETGLYAARIWPEEGGAYLRRGFALANAIELD